jgi:hypothetical protein
MRSVNSNLKQYNKQPQLNAQPKKIPQARQNNSRLNGRFKMF